MIDELASVLTVDKQMEAIRVCHQSFLDFLGDREHLGEHSGEIWTGPGGSLL